MKNSVRALVVVAVAAIFGFSVTQPAEAGHGLLGRHCASEPACEPACVPACEPAPVCVKPAPDVPVTICVKDPVTCCTYEVCVCVPADCACETPCLASCRPGLLGRKILTYKWPCCGHCVEVVITKHGKTIVRD